MHEPRPATQGEILGMRMPPDGTTDLQDASLQNTLYFDDGGMRGLACALIWCSLLYHGTTMKDEDLSHPAMADLARSLLAIPTFHRDLSADENMGMIRRIIKQNVDSKKQAVSSYEWSMILRNLAEGKPKGKALTVSDAIDLYNSNPEVAAHGSGKDRWVIKTQQLNANSNGHGMHSTLETMVIQTNCH